MSLICIYIYIYIYLLILSFFFSPDKQDALLPPKVIRSLLDILYTLPSLSAATAKYSHHHHHYHHHHPPSKNKDTDGYIDNNNNNNNNTSSSLYIRQHTEIRERDFDVLIDSMMQSSTADNNKANMNNTNNNDNNNDAAIHTSSSSSLSLISETDAFSIFRLLTSWIVCTLSIFIDMPLCPGTEFLERRYNIDFEKTTVMNRYRISLEECELLLLVFRQHCRQRRNGHNENNDHSKDNTGSGMVLNDWISWICPEKSTNWNNDNNNNNNNMYMRYIARPLAEAVFVSKLSGNKTEWRFFDFAEFAISFGTVPLEVLATSAVGTFVGQVNGNHLTVECMKRVRKLLFLLSLSYTYEVDHNDDKGVWEKFEQDPLSLPLPQPVETALKTNVTDKSTLIEMISMYSSAPTLLLPGLRDLTLVANGLFGVPPATPLLEKECITELTLRYQAIAPQDRSAPFGPAGSMWALISADWWHRWRMFVGSAQHSGATHAYTPSPPPPPTTATATTTSTVTTNSNGQKTSKFSKLFGKSKISSDNNNNNNNNGEKSNRLSPSDHGLDVSTHLSTTTSSMSGPPIPDSIDNSLITKERTPIVVANDQKGIYIYIYIHI